jgi:ankyrin repeat protein
MASNTTRSILNQLNQIQDSLSSVYEGEIKRAIEQDPQQAQLTIETLTWLYSAQRPLSSKELMNVLDATSGRGKASISAILESCSGLVWLDVTTGDIAFMHYSVHEFFDSYPGKDFLLGEGFIAVQCLDYLVGSSHSVSTVEELKDCLNDLPFYSYAASFWGRHCSHLKDPSPDLITLCRRLLIEEPNLTRALAHLTCQPQVDEFPSENRLFESSGLHLVCHFGIAWAIPIAVEKLALGLKDKRDSTPLHLTAEEGKLLKDEWGRTPLHLAAEEGFPECVEELRKRILLDPLEKDQFDKTAYHYAAMSKNPGLLQGLGHPREVLGRDNSGKYPLDYAASRGNVQVTRLLLDMSPSQDALRSALRTALENGKTEVSGTLLEYGPIPDGSHLLVAVKGGFETAVKQLLECGCAIDDAVDDEGTALHTAARTSILAFLIWNGANLEAGDKQGRTALACAVTKGDSEAVHTLLKAGAESKVIVHGEEEAVVYAAARGMTDITKLLLEAGTNAKPAAFAAVKHGQYEVMHQLLESGLAPDTSWNGRTLLQEANEAGSKTIEALLRSAGHYSSAPRFHHRITEI